jgi:hypothetical protein
MSTWDPKAAATATATSKLISFEASGVLVDSVMSSAKEAVVAASLGSLALVLSVVVQC